MAKAKRGLGKGLGALIPQENVTSRVPSESSINEIALQSIVPNKDQPRKHFDRAKISTLAESIRIHGIVQPIVLKNNNDGTYSIVAGERRWRAAKECGLEKVPAVVKEVDNKTLAELALVENLQREDLNDIEEALAYKYLKDSFKMTQEQISISVGKSRAYIANILRLLKLDELTREYVETGKISGGHGRALLSVENVEVRRNLLEQIVNNEMSVREIEKLVSNLKKSKEAKSPQKVVSEVRQFENYLESYFSTKVRIKGTAKKRKIEIELYSDEEFNRILELLDYTD